MLFKRKQKLIILMGTMTIREAEQIKTIDHDNLIIAFCQIGDELGSNQYHVACNHGDEHKVYELFQQIREY